MTIAIYMHALLLISLCHPLILFVFTLLHVKHILITLLSMKVEEKNNIMNNMKTIKVTRYYCTKSIPGSWHKYQRSPSKQRWHRTRPCSSPVGDNWQTLQ